MDHHRSYGRYYRIPHDGFIAFPANLARYGRIAHAPLNCINYRMPLDATSASLSALTPLTSLRKSPELGGYSYLFTVTHAWRSSKLSGSRLKLPLLRSSSE